MTWPDILDALDQELRAALPLLVALQANNPSQPQQLLQFEADSRKAIDQACRAFALNRRWPALNQAEARLVYDRLRQARHCAEWLSDHFLPNPQSESAEILEFLLVDSWYQVGLLRWSMVHQSRISGGPVDFDAP
ncbi:MAG: hypothetical protein WCO56_26765 [Verrucomicrobiota bacterium]